MANKFVRELEIFRNEEETAQQCFFAYLAIRNMAAENRNVLEALNANPLFWLTVQYGTLSSTFVMLGRIFDQQSPHSIYALMSAVSADIEEFSIAALKARRISGGSFAQEAAEYVSDAHELTLSE